MATKNPPPLVSNSANSVVLGGVVAKAPQTRYSPAGVPITRFVLTHESQQEEAGFPRVVGGQIMVVASGDLSQAQLRHIDVGDSVEITGFLNQVRSAQGQYRWLLHARAIKFT